MYGELVKLCFVHSVLNDLLLLCITLRITVPIRVQIVQLYHETPCSSIFRLKVLSWKLGILLSVLSAVLLNSIIVLPPNIHSHIPYASVLPPFLSILAQNGSDWNLVEQQHSVSSVLYKYRRQKVADISLPLRLRCGNNWEIPLRQGKYGKRGHLSIAALFGVDTLSFFRMQ